jgi:hypothetical protein
VDHEKEELDVSSMRKVVGHMLNFFFNFPLNYFALKLVNDELMGVQSLSFNIPSFTQHFFIFKEMQKDKSSECVVNGHNMVRERNLVIHGNVCYYR